MAVSHPRHYALDHLIGESSWTQRVRKRVMQVANYQYSVLVTGPSGTGKEVIARAIHAHSNRHAHPFIPVNCAAIPQSLFSSQLFGHIKGAFTGAQFAAIGCFRAAEGGTIFLDEIGELDLECQAKLLRVLQEKVVTPVGSHQGIATNVRTIAATNRDLYAEVRAGRFRLDLYYRLNVLSIDSQRLADRPEDIPPLVRHFLAKTAVECGIPLRKISPEAIALLQSYDWPGNVRELENAIERAVVTWDDEVLDAEAFSDILESVAESSVEFSETLSGNGPFQTQPPDFMPCTVARTEPSSDGIVHDGWPSLAEHERTHLIHTLKTTYFNQSAAARLLKIDRKLLASKIKKHKIPVPRSSGSS